MDASVGPNCSQLDFVNMSCFIFNKHQFESIRWAKIGVSTLAGVICCLAILLIVFLKAYKKFVHRLALYLCIAAFFNSIGFLLQILPVKDKCDYVVVSNEAVCKAAGISATYTFWVILLLTCWITLHLFILAVFKRNYHLSRKYEIGAVAACYSIPFLISVIPFIHFTEGSTMYGLAGAWCWIKLTDMHCNEYEEGLVEQFALWYGPFMLFVLLNFLAMVVVMVVLCKGKRGAPSQLQNQYKSAIKEALPLLFYPIVFNLIYSLAFVNRVYYAVTKKTIFPLWTAHAIADPCVPLLVPLAFLLHPYTLRKLNCLQFKKAANQWKHHSQRSSTHFVVSKEDASEEQRLIIGGSEKITSGYESFLRVQ